MSPTLDDLLNDGRLARLFSKEARHCALQLWILQVKSGQSTENRVIYGRLLPYSHSSDEWYASDDDNFYTFKGVQTQVILLNLYIKSTLCADLLRHLSVGRTISAISDKLKLKLSNKLKARFGTAALVTESLVYRPVVCLLNRGVHDLHSTSSPHDGAGAFSASITQANKGALFRLEQDYDVALTEFVVKHLNASTGLDFGGTDASRFGDLELLVFPALNELDQSLLSVGWVGTPRTLVARFNPTQVPYFSGFQFRLSIANDGQITYSGLATAERNSEGVFECKFEVSDSIYARTDSTELEIFGFHGDQLYEGTLCCRWKASYFREVNIRGHVDTLRTSPVKFDWLEKTTRPSLSARTKAALTINRDNFGYANLIGGREPDPWVPINSDFLSLFARLHPPKSEGRFFLRWGQSDGEGRLQFVEWFKALLAKYQKYQVVIFDPYFEDVGLGLLMLCASSEADYIVFRSLPKPVKDGSLLRRKSDKSLSEGINNLLSNCEQSRHQLGRIKLRIYGLKEGRLHDRYILIIGPDGLPVTGFSLSNSFQKAAENYPLLVTPIPSDVLLKVEQYKSGLMQQVAAAQPGRQIETPYMQLLYDSTASPTEPRHYEPLLFLEKLQAGDVLSIWSNEPSLKGLSGKRLKKRMAALGMLKDNSLSLPEMAGLCNCLDQQGDDFTDFTPTWEVLGEALAHSRTEANGFCELESESGFLEFLAQFLTSSFDRSYEEVDRELAVTDSRLFRESAEAMMYSAYRPHHFLHAIKYTALTWPEYYAIKFLWWYSPDSLVTIAEVQMVNVPMEPQGPDAVRLSLLSQIVSEIAESVQIDISTVQRDRLVQSSNGLLQWMGLNAIEMQLEKPKGLEIVLQLVADFTRPEQVRALGWMVHHAARNQKKTKIYKGLIAALHEALPATIKADELRHLIDSMRGHMRQLAWAEPWLFQDVVLPLLRNDRTSIDDACNIWIQELASMLEPQPKDRPQLFFDRAREGQTTNITAFLYAHSSSERQRASLNTMQAILKRQQRVVQQPLASTSDWTRWNGALTVSMWMLAFTRWAQYYQRERGTTDQELDQLMQKASALAMVRPMGEWRSEGASKEGHLVAFLDQAEELLESLKR